MNSRRNQPVKNDKMKKTYLIPQVTKQEVRLTTQIFSDTNAGNYPGGGSGNELDAPARRLYI